MNIKEIIMEKFNMAKTWVLDNKLKASAIALGLILALVLPSVVWKLVSLLMIAYFIGMLIDKYNK